MRAILLVFSVFAINFAFAEQITFPSARASAQTQGWHGLRFDSAQRPVRAGDEDTLFFSNIISKMDLEKITIQGQDFTALFIEDYVFHGKIGYPKLPAKTQLLEIPIGAEIKINILSSEYLDVALNEKGFENQLLPVQAPVRKSATQAPMLRKNTNAYLQNSFTERDLVIVEDLGIMKDRRFAQFNILPVRYLASENVVRVYYVVEFEVIFDQKKADTDNQSVSATQTKTKYTKHTTKTVPNPKIYKIISDRKFESTLTPFVNWKIEMGFDVWVSYTDQPEVGNTTASIKAYLQDIYESENRADFLLLVGDTDEIPAFQTKLSADSEFFLVTGTGSFHVTDFYYAEYTGDNLPDVFYGRLSANTPIELRNQIEKIIVMEQLAMDSTGFLRNSLLIAGPEEASLSRSRILNATVNYAQNYYFNLTNHIHATVLFSPNSGNEAPLIRSKINEGVGFVNYTGHGNWDMWERGYQNALISINDIRNFTNVNKYPVVISNACLTNKFDEPVCFGEALVRAERRGAVAHIGASNNTFFVEDFQWSVGSSNINTSNFNPNDVTPQNSGPGVFDRMFSKNETERAKTLGEIMFFGNMAVQLGNVTYADIGDISEDTKKYYWEIYHILGDPSFQPHLFDPNNPPSSTVRRLPKDDMAFDVFVRNEQLHIHIEAETPSRATIRLVNMLGQHAATILSNGIVSVGKNEFYFDLSTLPKGVYVCTYFDGVRAVSRKIVW